MNNVRPSADDSATPADHSMDEVDAEVLQQTAAIIGEDGLVGLIDVFLGDLHRLLNEFAHALEAAEPPRAQRSVHALKSAAAYVGARRFAALCDALEDAARRDDMPMLAARWPELHRRGLRIEAELQRARARHAGDASAA